MISAPSKAAMVAVTECQKSSQIKSATRPKRVSKAWMRLPREM